MRTAAFASILLFASSAAGAPGELLVSAEPGVALEWGRDGARPGALLGLELRWGLDDFAWLLTSAQVGALPRSSDAPSPVVIEAMLGGAWALDVLRWVPHVELLAGVAGPTDAPRPTGRFGVGVDYLLSERWSVGPVLRVRPLPTDDGVAGWVSAQLRISRRLQL